MLLITLSEEPNFHRSSKVDKLMFVNRISRLFLIVAMFPISTTQVV